MTNIVLDAQNVVPQSAADTVTVTNVSKPSHLCEYFIISLHGTTLKI